MRRPWFREHPNSSMAWTMLVLLVACCNPGHAATPLQEARFAAPNGLPDDLFGNSVAVDENTAIVGAPAKGAGAAYVYFRSGGVWTQQAVLSASDGVQGDRFGYSVSISGDSALIGAYAAASQKGAAYVFVRSGATWTQQAKLLASDGGLGDRFGFAVSLSGDTALVGADGKNSQQGSAYVFVRSGSTWTQQAVLAASDGATNDRFGFSVSLSSDTGVIGAYGKASRQGAAYIYVRSSGVWTQQARLIADDGRIEDGFGFSVSLAGNTSVIGALEKNDGRGSAYVYMRSGNVWTKQTELIANDGAPGDRFGQAVAINGDTIVVGSPCNYSPAPDQGALYVYLLVNGAWTLEAKLTASDGAEDDELGDAVAVSGDTAIGGAPFNSAAHGAAYLFRLPMAISSVLDAAGYQTRSIAAEALYSVFGAYLGNRTEAASSVPLPPALAGTTASITDSANVTRPASLLLVSPGQLNILTPSGLALGPARLTVTNSTGQSAVSSVSISAVSPGLFAADASGKGPAAANVVNVAADGRQTVSLAADCQGTPLRCATVPIDLGSEGERVFVIFYGTGIRGRSSLDRVAVSVGGTPVEASYAGVQPQFPGLDQINLELPRSLAGRGVTDVRVSVDGLAANTVQIEIR